MRYAVGKGCFITVAGGNEFEDNVPPFGTNPTSVLAEIASRIPGVVSVAAVDRAQGPRVLLEHRQLHRAGGAGRSRSAASAAQGSICQQTFDFNFTDTFLLPPAQYHAPRFDVIGYIAVSWHVDGGAARRGRRGDADAAGRHRSGRHRRDPREDRGRSRHGRAATTRSGSDWSMRARRCADWGWRSETTIRLAHRRSRARRRRSSAQDAPSLSDPSVLSWRRSSRSPRSIRSMRCSARPTFRSSAAACQVVVQRHASSPSSARRASARTASARISAAGRRSSSAFR